MQSPVGVGPLASPDGGVVLADAYTTTKVQVRAGASTAAAAFLGGSYGSSIRNADGDLVCGTRPDEWTIYGNPGRAGASWWLRHKQASNNSRDQMPSAWACQNSSPR